MVFSLPGRKGNLHRPPISHRRNSSTVPGFPPWPRLYGPELQAGGSRSGPASCSPPPLATARTLRGDHSACFSSGLGFSATPWVSSLVHPGPVSPRHTVAPSGLELGAGLLLPPKDGPAPECVVRPGARHPHVHCSHQAGRCGNDPSDCSLRSYADDAFYRSSAFLCSCSLSPQRVTLVGVCDSSLPSCGMIDTFRMTLLPRELAEVREDIRAGGTNDGFPSVGYYA